MARALSTRSVALGAGLVGTISALLLAQSADLSVTSISAPDGIVGTPVTVSVGISGPAGATGVTVTAIFQPAVDFHVGGSSPGCVTNAAAADAATTITCPATGVSSVAISVSPRRAGTLNVVAGVVGDGADPVMANNSRKASIPIVAGSTPTASPTVPPPTATRTPTNPGPTPTRTSTPPPTSTPTRPPTPTATPTPLVNGAAFVSQSAPATVPAGAAFSAMVTMKNTGTTTWTTSAGDRLGSLVPGDPWGSRVDLAGTISIGPGQQASFAVSAVAPQAAGAYSFQWRMIQESIGWFGASSPIVNVTVTAAPLKVYSVPPCRVIDTRNVDGPYGGPALSASETRLFAMRGVCGIPSTARAILLSMAALYAGSDGYFVLFPANVPRPPVSSLNYRAGFLRSNNGIVSLDSSGRMAVFASQPAGTVQLIVDVTGYLQ